MFCFYFDISFLPKEHHDKTYSLFFTRAADHMGISNLTGKRLKSVKQSAISAHLLECNCSIDFDHFDILASDANKLRPAPDKQNYQVISIKTI